VQQLVVVAGNSRPLLIDLPYESGVQFPGGGCASS